MKVDDDGIINATVHTSLPDHVCGEEFSDRFAATFIPGRFLLLLVIGSAFRLGLSRPIRMSGSSTISRPASASTGAHLPETTTSDSGQGNARRA